MMTPETTVTVQAVLLILTASVGVLTFINARKKDIQKEARDQQDTYLFISKDLTKLGVKIDTFGDEMRDLRKDVKELNEQVKEVNERAIRQEGKIEKQGERLQQLEKRVDALEMEVRR